MVEEDLTWREFVYEWIVRRCNEKGLRTFSLTEIYKDGLTAFQEFKPENQNVRAKVRQQLQFLRNRDYIEFLDNAGNYRLRGEYSLKRELEKNGTIDLTKEAPERLEYKKETIIRGRKKKFVRETKERLGFNCIYKECGNSFKKPDKTHYIEVHHIVPVCEGGLDKSGNLSVLCAHHHRMAHFADDAIRRDIKAYLLDEVERRLDRVREMSG